MTIIFHRQTLSGRPEWGIYKSEVRGASDVGERGESDGILHCPTVSIAKIVLKEFIPGWVSQRFVHAMLYLVCVRIEDW